MILPGTPSPFPLRWGFSTREDEGFSFDGTPLHQVHGSEVVEADGEPHEADGVWTTHPGRTLGIRVADCVPILLAGPLGDGTPWIAALHAGWRGATAGILRRGVGIYLDFGGQPAHLAYAFGPCIQACHFEVGEEVIEAARLDPAWREDLRHPGTRGKPHLDLQGFLKAQAFDLGLDPARNGSSPLCTVCERDLLWSYRRGDALARQWGWIQILP